MLHLPKPTFLDRMPMEADCSNFAHTYYICFPMNSFLRSIIRSVKRK